MVRNDLISSFVDDTTSDTTSRTADRCQFDSHCAPLHPSCALSLALSPECLLLKSLLKLNRNTAHNDSNSDNYVRI
jgi:hypothetical protein